MRLWSSLILGNSDLPGCRTHPDPAPAPAGLGTTYGTPSAPRWGGHVGLGRFSPLISTWQKAAESRTRADLEVKSAHQEPRRSRRQTAPRGKGRPPPQHPTSPRPSFGAEGEAIPDTPIAAPPRPDSVAPSPLLPGAHHPVSARGLGSCRLLTQRGQIEDTYCGWA